VDTKQDSAALVYAGEWMMKHSSRGPMKTSWVGSGEHQKLMSRAPKTLV